MTYTKGKLLVAVATLEDRHFNRTVVFMLEHDHQGALGVVLNDPMLVHPEEIIKDWADQFEDQAVIYRGGPVATDAVIGIARTQESSEKSLVGRVEIIDLHLSPAERSDVKQVRVFAGYGGWSAGQLEAEIEEGSWLVLEAQEDDIFHPEADTLWAKVLTRQGGLVGRMAQAPDDLSQN